MSVRSRSVYDGKPKVSWYAAMVPINMAVGSIGTIITLLALSLGANVAEVGLLQAAGAVATVMFSTMWGKLSDLSGIRRTYLIIIFAVLGPVFVILGVANSVPQLILFYAMLNIFSSGITPIAVMFAVEKCRSKNWEGEVAKYNSITNLGNICGLILDTIVASFLHVSWLFYISAFLCLISVIIFWWSAKEPEITLERHAFNMRNFHVERLLSPKPIFHYLSLQNFRLSKGRKRFRLNPIQMLFLAVLVQWIGIFALNVGEIPLMKNLNLSDSEVLAVQASSSFVSVLAFAKIAPAIKLEHRKIINISIIFRGILILGWAGLSLLLVYPVPYVFIFPLILAIIWPISYAMIWIPIVTFAISSSPANGRGSTQGALMSVNAVANVLGSTLGGLIMATLGYTIGFIAAAIICILSLPIFSRIDMI